MPFKFKLQLEVCLPVCDSDIQACSQGLPCVCSVKLLLVVLVLYYTHTARTHTQVCRPGASEVHPETGADDTRLG